MIVLSKCCNFSRESTNRRNIKKFYASKVGSVATMADTSQQRTSQQRTSVVARMQVHKVNFWQQVELLCWKLSKQKRRSGCCSTCEMIMPAIGAILLLFLTLISKSSPVDEKIYSPIELTSESAAGNLTHNDSRMLYAPNTTLVYQLMLKVQDNFYQDGLPAEVMGFASEKELENYYKDDDILHKNFPVSVVFLDIEGASTWPTTVTYKIRPETKSGDQWLTRRIFPTPFKLTPEERKLYFERGFLYAQLVIDNALINQWAPSYDRLSFSWQINRIPFPKHLKEGMLEQIQNAIWLMQFSFLVCIIAEVKSIVYEKEKQLKESMKLMGLSAAAYMTSWFLWFFFLQITISLIYAVCMTNSLSSAKPMFQNSSFLIVYLFFFMYSFAVIAYICFASTFFNSATTAAAISSTLFYVSSMPEQSLKNQYPDMSITAKLALCAIPNMALSLGVRAIAFHEGTGHGVQWNTFAKPPTSDDNFSLMHSVIMLGIDSIVLFILAWYLDNVHPGDYGVPRPLYFPLQPSYWCGEKRQAVFMDKQEVSSLPNENFESYPTGLPVGIQMIHLRKEYNKRQVALKDSTLSMFEGQITALLGHNGAGKTTTISILTGFFTPTSGTALVNGYDIRRDIVNVRRNLGLCPQHNVIFDYLTVDEHFYFFAKLKGCPVIQIPIVIDEMAKELGLQSKRNDMARTLSGGQKRKLCTGNALIGGSKVVILDEPTSGMDPAARRQIWDLLQRHRAGRTILLCTHFMDEADVLGDRIAIMVDGVIKCCGTSMFLKKRYGTAGSRLVMVKSPGCDVDAVTRAVQDIISTAKIESNISAELSYLLPKDKSELFPKLFNMIETMSGDLGIASFGVTATTMEEVFHKVNASNIVDDESAKPLLTPQPLSESHAVETKVLTTQTGTTYSAHVHPADKDYPTTSGARSTSVDVTGNLIVHNISPSENTNQSASRGDNLTSNGQRMQEQDILGFNKDFERLSSCSLLLSQFYGMFVKKAINAFRRRTFTAVQLLVPTIINILPLLLLNLHSDQSGDDPRLMNLSMFNEGTISAVSAGITESTLSESLARSYSSLFDGNNTIHTVPRTKYENMNTFFLDLKTANDLYNYLKKVVIGADFQPVNSTLLNATVWYSEQPLHAMPIALAYLMNAVLHQVTGNVTLGIMTINHPMPQDTANAKLTSLYSSLVNVVSFALAIMFGMAFLTASFSHFLIQERQTGAKHMQVVSGVGPVTFWMATMSWDLIIYSIPCFALLIVITAFQVDIFLQDGKLGIVFLLLLTFGLAILPHVYILQILFVTPVLGFLVFLVVEMTTGIITFIVVMLVKLYSPGLIFDVVEWIVMTLFPNYGLAMSLINVAINTEFLKICRDLWDTCDQLKELKETHPCCPEICEDNCLLAQENYLAFDYPGVGGNLIFMLIHGVACFTITLLIDYRLLQKLAYCQNPTDSDYKGLFGNNQSASEDDDVAAERKRVMSNDTQGNVLVLKNLFKTRGSFVTVDHICVGVSEQECFGLLGQNGAGKTTTFQMLTGDIMASGGDAIVVGYSIRTDIKRIQSNLGYCPQFDALLEKMTGRETLTMYARLKGVPAGHIPRVVNHLLEVCQLQKYANELTAHYSGGNKRKLSLAIALIGNPSVILLDEPSTGMDPGIRRHMWNLLSKVRESGKTLVLTSHSMEECDALCTRIVIMVNGQFKCLGSPQHLKSKFGQGYTLTIKMITLSDGLFAPYDPVVNYITNIFPGTQVFEAVNGYIQLQVPKARFPLSHVFSALEMSKSELNVEDYSVNQTSLEEVFLTFTRHQYPPRQIESNLCKCRE